MRKNKLLLLLALLMTAATGAWADETLLLTIESRDYKTFKSGSKTFDDKVTVTFSNSVQNDGDNWGWYANSSASLLTVAGINGYTITSCKFYVEINGDAMTGYTIKGESPSVYLNNLNVYTDNSQSVKIGKNGVTKIEVYEAAAPAGYTVSLKDGVKDADKWTISPNPAPEGSPVTIQYTGRLKVKGVKATVEAPAEATPALSINSPSVGQVIGSDGKNYDYGSLPTGVTAVAKICYVSGSNGLALALTDEEGTMEWRPAMETIAAHTAPFTGVTWKVASKDEWSNMITAAGSYTALRDGFSSVGGTNMQSNYYWTSTEWDSNGAWSYNFSDGYWASDPMDFENCVRACLAFTVEQGGAAYTLLSAATTADYGKVVCAAGHLHDAKTAVPTGCTAVGILGKVTETGHGLILALQNATEQEWETIDGWTSVTTYAGTTLKVLPDDDARGSLTSYTKLGETAVSNWAVAQKSDYEAIFENLGSTQSDGFNGTTYNDNVNAFITTGVDGLAILGFYWSATEESDYNESWNFYNYCWTTNRKSTCYNVRPVLGFGGEAAPAVKPAATVTTAPTGAAIVGVGKTTALVSGGVADGGTLWYAVTTTNTKPTSTAGFSDAVPTAETITASGTVYVWYYVKADDTHSDSEIAATAIEVPVADIVWDVTNVSDLEVWGDFSPYTKEGVTLSGNSENVQVLYDNYGDPETDGIVFEAFGSGGFTFTAPTGKAFTKIEMKAVGIAGWDGANLGTGWAYNNTTVTWKGTAAASTVGLLTDADMFSGEPIISIVFYLSE